MWVSIRLLKTHKGMQYTRFLRAIFVDGFYEMLRQMKIKQVKNI